MKRFATLASLASLVALVAVVPVTAAKPTHPTHPAHPAHPAHSAGHKSGAKSSCTPLNKGYYGKGELVSGTVTPGTRKGRYDGALTVDVTRANHRAPTGSQTFSLSNARVRFGKGVRKTALAAGERVVLHGKVTVLPHGCSTSGFTSTITVHHVRISAARH